MGPMSSSEVSSSERDADAALLERHGDTLLAAAEESVAHGLRHGRPKAVDPRSYPAELRVPRATFVTLKRKGALRGCVGSCEPCQPLVKDVAQNAFAAAFRDSRFKPLSDDEAADLDLSISLLSPAEPVPAASEAELLARLRPGRDGVILGVGDRRAVYLPEVWEMVSGPEEFLASLKLKAGLPRDYWSKDLRAFRFTTRAIARSSSPVGF